MTKLLNVRSEYEEELDTFRSNRWNQSLGCRKGCRPRSTAVRGTERVPRRFPQERRSGSDFRRRYSNVKEGLEVAKEANCRAEHGLHGRPSREVLASLRTVHVRFVQNQR